MSVPPTHVWLDVHFRDDPDTEAYYSIPLTVDEAATFEAAMKTGYAPFIHLTAIDGTKLGFPGHEVRVYFITPAVDGDLATLAEDDTVIG